MYEIENKVFKDPLYGYIRVKCKLISDLIDSKEMQRLRRIKQLSGVSMVFHIAEHTRFSHSLGSYELARRITEEVNDVKIRFSEYEKMVFLCAALLHDLGHGPYSHAFENIYKVNHEKMTSKILLSNTEVNKILTDYNPNLAEDVASIIDHGNKFPLIEELITSQLDIDRLDYLKRDAYFTGANYGDIDYTILFRAMAVRGNKIVYKVKSIHTIEDFLMSRYHMYWQVYFHAGARGYEYILEKIYKRINYLIDKNFDFGINLDALKNVLSNKEDIKSYIELDDTYINGAIKYMQYSNDKILSDLCYRLINRKLFESVEYSEEKYNEILKDFKYDKDYYFKVDKVSKAIYDERDKGIEILLEDGTLQPLHKLSILPQTKTTSLKRIFYLK